MRLYLVGLFSLTLMAQPASSQTAVADGETLWVDGTTYRLWSIDAPETTQSCADGWPAGVLALEYLRELVQGKVVVCRHRTFNKFGGIVAVCRADGRDLGAAMVRAGMAWAFVRYSKDYTGLEQMAKRERFGVHLHGCEPAWELRAARRPTP